MANTRSRIPASVLYGTPPSISKISNLSSTQKILERVLLANILDIPLSEMFADAEETTPIGDLDVQRARRARGEPEPLAKPPVGASFDAWRRWNDQQGAENPMAAAPVSTAGILGDKLRSGSADDYIKGRVFQGDRVADLTPEQLAIMSQLPGLTDRTMTPNVPMAGYNQILAGRGLPTQTVGETPEVITAKEDLRVIPRQVSWGASNPLALEENQVGMNPNALMKRRGLTGRAEGGFVRKGQSVVVGEKGQPETLMSATKGATRKALSGAPSTDINKATTERYISESVAQPLRREYEQYTNPLIQSAYAGPGYWSSARAGAQGRAAENVGAKIGEIGSNIRYTDEQARRGLSESAANRSLSAIPGSLSVMAHPLMMGQMGANIGLTQAQTGAVGFGVERGQKLLSGELGQQGANIGATRAGTKATEFGVSRGQKLLPGEMGGQQAATEAMQFQTERGRELLPAELEQMQAGIQQILAGVGLTDVQAERLNGMIQQDMARTGMIEAETERLMRSMGMMDAQIEQVKAQTAQMDADLMRAPLDYQQQQQQIIAQQIGNLTAQMGLAGVQQAQNQAELDAALAKFLEENEAAYAIFQQLMALFSEPQQTAIVDPGTEGIAGNMLAAGAQMEAGGMSRRPMRTGAPAQTLNPLQNPTWRQPNQPPTINPLARS